MKARKEKDRREREEAEKGRPTGDQRPSLPPSGYAGTYHHPVLGRAMVEEKGGKLHLRIERNEGLQGDLEPWQYDTFRVEWSDPYLRTSLIPFRLDERGRAVEFRMKVRPDFVDPMEYPFRRQP